MGCLALLRTDWGTENGVMVAMQCYFHQDRIAEFSGEKAHQPSTDRGLVVIFQKRVCRLVDRLLQRHGAMFQVLVLNCLG